MKATKNLLFLNESVQKLATAHAMLNYIVNKPDAIRILSHCKQL